MSHHFVSFILGLALVATGIIARPYLQALGPSGPYLLVILMWVTIAVFLMAWRRLSIAALISSIAVSTAICIPIIAYMVNNWLGIGVGAVVFYLVFKWAEKLKDQSPQEDGSNQ